MLQRILVAAHSFSSTSSSLSADCELVILDNHASPERLGQAPPATTRIRGALHDRELIDEIFANYNIGCVMLMTGSRALWDSAYLAGCLSLCRAMAAAGVFRLVFGSSSSACDESAQPASRKDLATGMPQPFSDSVGLMAEEALRNLALSDPRWRIALLRYFNPVGAAERHASDATSSDLLQYIARLAIGRLKSLLAFDNDCQPRPPIQVVDLADSHFSILQATPAQNCV